jgi:site-specific DNA-methyltransferase (adenine-specific)
MKDKASMTIKPYYHKPGVTLYHGDCLEILSSLHADSVDMMFADPPYNLSNGGFSVHAGKRVSVNKGMWDKSGGIDVDFSFHLEWIEACKRVLKPAGTLWISGTYHSIYQCGYALQRLGFKILNDIIWYKPNASPNLSGRYFTASHETLLWAKKDEKAKHTFNYKHMKNGSWPDDMFKNPGKQMRSAWAIPETDDFWAISTPKPAEKRHGKHPTQKPVALLKRIILSSTNEGDTILDPFTGSSTTGIVASQHRRLFVGVDTEAKYLDLSIKRFAELEETTETELFAK